MDKIEARLVACFLAVFPNLTAEGIAQASATSMKSWDSLATVTLFAVIEEEFGISVDDENSVRFDSFTNILTYLQGAVGRRQIPSNGDLE